MLALIVAPLLALGTFEPTLVTRIDAPDGRPALQAGVLSQPLPSPLRESVRRWALDRAAELGLPEGSTLGEPQVFGTRFGASFHMAQEVGGVEVNASRVVVTIDRMRRVVMVSSGIAPYERAATAWTLSADAAHDAAARDVPLAMRTSAGKPYGGTVKRMFPVGSEVRAGYLVWVPTLDMRDNWYVAVDAADGRILFRQNRAFRAGTEADVYEFSPGGLGAGVGVSPLTRVVLDKLSPMQEGGFLQGSQVTAYNCCPNQECSTAPGAAKRRAQGQLNFGGMLVPYDVAICDRLQRATNDENVNPAGNYVYAPVDSPGGAQLASQANPSDSDPFVEAHAFWHVNRVYDFIRGLSTSANTLFPGENIPPFQMRDEARGKVPAVWVNVVIPDQNEMFSSYFTTGTARANGLMRMDNAAFMARENFQSLLIPELALDVDTLMMFQGTQADFGYDAPVLWHEFGHGVIHSTAKFESFTVDKRSGNNEGGALHEGIADYIAAAFGQRSTIGEYVGPRMAMAGGEAALRDADNTEKCPDVLWGEVHQDSKHFTGALWEARRELFQGTDMGRTFDAAIFAALVSMNPKTDFEGAAAAIVLHVGNAFPQMANASGAMEAILVARGVSNCSKVLDVTGVTEPRRYFGIGGTQAAGLANGQVVPGPHQFKIHVPEGARSLTVNAQIQGGSPFGGGQVAARLMARNGDPVEFTRSGTTIANDAEVTANFTGAQGNYSATVQLAVPCGGDLYFAIGSASQGGETLQNVSWSFQKALSCPPKPDAGTDAGTIDVDAGVTVPEGVPAIPGGGTDAGGQIGEAGCGCGATDGFAAALALMVLAGLGVRRRRSA